MRESRALALDTKAYPNTEVGAKIFCPPTLAVLVNLIHIRSSTLGKIESACNSGGFISTLQLCFRANVPKILP
jgi:hypothetical protein